MAKIVLVHGMNMQSIDREPLYRLWTDALLNLLKRTELIQARPELRPQRSDIEIVYWADLFKWPNFDAEAAAAKGLISLSREAYYDACRLAVRAADKLSTFNKEGRPSNALAAFLDRIVAQTAIYMHNGPVYHPDPKAGDGAFFQVQARFAAALEPDTQLVIGHSLGSVVSYEGLCGNPHQVRTFITIGSPLASPDLILKPLRKRSVRRFGGSEDGDLPWPDVARWTNFYAGADVWCVPVEGLSHLFKHVRDVRVEHGTPLEGSKTHMLTAYLEHIEIGDAIAEALAA
ncbi:MAG TPA: hypothetical protein VGC79_25005 [Polyangiaceae bacterium]